MDKKDGLIDRMVIDNAFTFPQDYYREFGPYIMRGTDRSEAHEFFNAWGGKVLLNIRRKSKLGNPYAWVFASTPYPDEFRDFMLRLLKRLDENDPYHRYGEARATLTNFEMWYASYPDRQTSTA